MKSCAVIGSMIAGAMIGAVVVTMYRPAREVVKKTTDAVIEQISNEGNRILNRAKQNQED